MLSYLSVETCRAAGGQGLASPPKRLLRMYYIRTSQPYLLIGTIDATERVPSKDTTPSRVFPDNWTILLIAVLPLTRQSQQGCYTNCGTTCLSEFHAKCRTPTWRLIDCRLVFCTCRSHEGYTSQQQETAMGHDAALQPMDDPLTRSTPAAEEPDFGVSSELLELRPARRRRLRKPKACKDLTHFLRPDDIDIKETWLLVENGE